MEATLGGELPFDSYERLESAVIYQTAEDGLGVGKELVAKGFKTKRGSTIRGILKNEKYMGDLLLGKIITVDPITKQCLDNMGEEEQYYIKDHHEPIISKEAFENARKIREKRNKNKNKGRIERYNRIYL
ncbi:hypothetical protein AN1V17_51090 [Vallitalea sediminicola]